MRYLYFKNKETFNNMLKQIPDSALCYIEDSKEIWTHQTMFGTPLEIVTIHSPNGIIDDSMLIKDGYQLLSFYAIKNNTIYPIIRLRNQLSVINVSVKSIVAIGGSDVLSYELIEDCDIVCTYKKNS